MLRMVLTLTTCAVLSFMGSVLLDPPPVRPCEFSGCDIELTNLGSAAVGTRSPVHTAAAGNNLVPIPDPPTSDPCPWMAVDDLGASSSWWGDNDPSAGRMELNRCVLGDTNIPGGGIIQLRFVPNAAPIAAAPPPDPAVLARQAIGRLAVPRPSIGVGPDRTKLAVQLWTWLWVDSPAPAPVTVTLAGVSVTATATLTSTTWSLGEPASTGDGYHAGPPVTVTCMGAGSAPPVGYDWQAEPPCGHMFHWRSLKERTGGTGMWPITATTNWDVAWQSNTGAAGTDTLTATAADQFDIAEYRIVLVGPGG